MYDGNKINLKKFNTYEERLNYLNENIFSKEHYINFYGYSDKYVENTEEKEKIEHQKLDKYYPDRWLGMKKENSDAINYHVRNTINYLTTYLIGAKEISTDSLIKRYLTLKANKISRKKIT